jgi:hypothetical protein
MFNRIKLTVAVLALSVLASGCSLLGDNLDKVAKGAGEAVTFYCENVTLPEVREELRAAVNRHAAPNSLTIECAAGGPVLNSADSGAPSE